MIALVKRFFGCSTMVDKHQVVGEIPETRQAYKDVFALAWPSVVERVLVSMVSAVDTMMVGGLGPLAIASIGITQQPILILLAIIFSLNVGVLSIVARRVGEKDFEAANKVVRQSILLIIVLSIILSIVGMIYSETVLIWMGATADVLPDAVTYLRIILCGFMFNAIGININSALRGAGNTKVSMRSNITANLVNLVLNFILIEGRFGAPALGVAGAGIATIIGQSIACLISLSALFNKDADLKISKGDSWKPEFGVLKNVIKISGGAFVDQICMRLGFLMYVRIVTSLGMMAYATHQICIIFSNFSYSVGEGFSIAASSLVGRNLGAKRPDLSIIYGKITERIGLAVSLILCGIYFTFREELFALFTEDAEVLALGVTVMVIVSIANIFQVPQTILSGALRGAGDTKFIAKVALVSITILRPICTYIYCYPLGLGLIGAWLAMMTDQFIRLMATYVRFSKGEWVKLRV
ncbi:MATE family efflux transporter [Candidatus Epulonipiscium viviparus]|uniref:MATE family efflux transporter n=1 Tax=Candidatus Epulonipiscium viviparus TaxID=420336 RepID=UPI00273808E1|nr:MATE family efflux transporter [Candidatus Epulopiscium viviparus]